MEMKMKILVVEDDEAQLLWLRRSLNDAGHEVRSMHDGDLGLATYKKFLPFDVVITDYCYPGKAIPDGPALIRAIRHLDSHDLELASPTAGVRDAASGCLYDKAPNR
jgi:CheY-like chemotaxis protein